MIALLLVLLLAAPAAADVEVYYNDPEVKGTVIFEGNGTMTARFDVPWEIANGQPAAGVMNVIAYWQDGVTPTRSILCGFVWFVSDDPACIRRLANHVSTTRPDRMIWTFTGAGTYPRRAVGLIVYPTVYAEDEIEFYHVVMTCAPDRGRTICATPLPPDPEPLPPPPVPAPRLPEATGWGEWSYGCGTFGC